MAGINEHKPYHTFCAVYSFVEMACFRLDKKQDPLSRRAFFGQQHARGGRCDNPNVKTFLENAQAVIERGHTQCCSHVFRNQIILSKWLDPPDIIPVSLPPIPLSRQIYWSGDW